MLVKFYFMIFFRVICLEKAPTKGLENKNLLLFSIIKIAKLNKV